MKNVNKCPKGIDLGIKIYFRKFLWEKEKKKNKIWQLFIFSIKIVSKLSYNSLLTIPRVVVNMIHLKLEIRKNLFIGFIKFSIKEITPPNLYYPTFRISITFNLSIFYSINFFLCKDENFGTHICVHVVLQTIFLPPSQCAKPTNNNNLIEQTCKKTSCCGNVKHKNISLTIS